MDFELFEDAGLLLMHRHRRYNLFSVQGRNAQIQLKPLPFAQELTSVKVATECRLIFTPTDVYDFHGNHLRAFSGESVFIKKLAKSFLIASAPENTVKHDCETELFLWKDEKTLLQAVCQSYQTSYEWLALRSPNSWSFYKSNGTEVKLEKEIPHTDDICICKNLIIEKNLGNYSLFSLRTGKLLKDCQVQIIGSCFRDFAICCALTSEQAEVYYKGKWTTYNDVDKCRIVDDKHGLFFIRRKGKYFLYNFDSTPFMPEICADGIDFVSYNSNQNTLMLMKDGHPSFFTIQS